MLDYHCNDLTFTSDKIAKYLKSSWFQVRGESPAMISIRKSLGQEVQEAEPVHTDHCEHVYDGGQFLFTFEYKPKAELDALDARPATRFLFDVYVFDGRDGPAICVRYGDEPEEHFNSFDTDDLLGVLRENRVTSWGGNLLVKSPTEWAKGFLLDGWDQLNGCLAERVMPRLKTHVESARLLNFQSAQVRQSIEGMMKKYIKGE